MAFRRLINQIDTLSGDGDVRGLRNDKGNTVGFALREGVGTPGKAFVDEAVVQAVLSDGTYAIAYNGMIQRSSATTDEPIRAGQVVYISQTIDGKFVVLGSAG